MANHGKHAPNRWIRFGQVTNVVSLRVREIGPNPSGEANTQFAARQPVRRVWRLQSRQREHGEAVEVVPIVLPRPKTEGRKGAATKGRLGPERCHFAETRLKKK